MKKILTLILAISSFSAFAECYTFYNGIGPARIGRVALAAPATKMCVLQTVRAEKLVFSDAEGDLAIVDVASYRERRPDGRVEFDLFDGTVSVYRYKLDFSGSKVVIEAGTLEAPTARVRRIQMNGETFFATSKH